MKIPNLEDKNETQKGIIALVCLSAIFASMGIYIRYLAVGFTPLQQVYLRVLVALIMSSALFRSKIDYTKYKKLPLKEWLLLFFRGTSTYLFGVALLTEAILLTKLSTVSFIQALPISQLLGFIFLKEKVKAYKVFFIITSFLGVILIGVTDYSHLFSWGIGETFALLSAIFVSFSYITRRLHTEILNNYEITQLTFVFAFLSVFVVSLLKGEGLPTQHWSLLLLIPLVLAGLANVFNLFLTNYGFQKVNVVLAGNLLTLESAFAIIFGLAFFNEVPTLQSLIGGIVIITSVIGMNTLEDEESKGRRFFTRFFKKQKYPINEAEVTS